MLEFLSKVCIYYFVHIKKSHHSILIFWSIYIYCLTAYLYMFVGGCIGGCEGVKRYKYKWKATWKTWYHFKIVYTVTWTEQEFALPDMSSLFWPLLSRLAGLFYPQQIVFLSMLDTQELWFLYHWFPEYRCTKWT